MSDCLISIIVPAYNVEKYFDECLSSLANQTFQELEVIVINDGSTDRTGKIADSYAEKFDNFKVIHQENLGIGKTREIGLQNASGKYIGWVDADDYVDVDMYRRLYQEAIDHDADIVICDYDFFPEKVRTKEKWFKHYKGKVDWNFIERNTQPWNKIARKEILDSVNMGHWLAYCADGAYALALITAKKIVTISDRLYHYRVGHVSMSSDYTNMKRYVENVGLTEMQKTALVETGLAEGWSEYYDYRIIYSVLQAILVAAYNAERELYTGFKDKLKALKWKKNKYTKVILENNHGKLKAFVLMNIIPLSYRMANLITKAVM